MKQATSSKNDAKQRTFKIGLVFNPAWTTSNVVVSETFSRLPLFAMHSYAKTVLDTLEPAKYHNIYDLERGKLRYS